MIGIKQECGWCKQSVVSDMEAFFLQLSLISYNFYTPLRLKLLHIHFPSTLLFNRTTSIAQALLLIPEAM